MNLLRLHIGLTALDHEAAAKHLRRLAGYIEGRPDCHEWRTSDVTGKATAKVLDPAAELPIVPDSGGKLPVGTGSKRTRREKSALQLAIKCVEEDLAQCLHAAHIVEDRREYDNAKKYRRTAKGREEALKTLRGMLPAKTTREEGEG